MKPSKLANRVDAALNRIFLIGFFDPKKSRLPRNKEGMSGTRYISTSRTAARISIALDLVNLDRLLEIRKENTVSFHLGPSLSQDVYQTQYRPKTCRLITVM